MVYLLAINGEVDYGLDKFVIGHFILGTAQLSVSFSNNYFDRHADKESVITAFSGGSKILVEHPEFEQTALRISILPLSLSIIGSIIFTVVYLYRGLSETVTMLAIGLLISGMGYFVASSSLDYLFYLFVFPLVYYRLFFILTVELPDVESDTIAEKETYS